QLEVAEDDEAGQQTDEAVHSLAAVGPDLAVALVDPVEPVDPERDECHHDREADPPLLSEGTGVLCRCVHVTPSMVDGGDSSTPGRRRQPNPSEMIPRSTRPRVKASEATTLTP